MVNSISFCITGDFLRLVFLHAHRRVEGGTGLAALVSARFLSIAGALDATLLFKMDTISIDTCSTSVDGGAARNSNNSKQDSSNHNVPFDKQSFASVVKENTVSKFNFPEREQAIIMDAIDDTQKNEYIVEVGKLVGPKNVIFASRISNNRICIYLSSKDSVNEFINKYGGITLNGVFIAARRLVSPAKRIILSNVSPSIPHDVINDELNKLGLKVVSKISFISAGLNIQDYKHVLSFRRQVYVDADHSVSIPESIVIQYNSNTFRIFVSTDEIKCFLCKKIGHIAKKCPTNNHVNAKEIVVTADIHINSDVIADPNVTSPTYFRDASVSRKADIRPTKKDPINIINPMKRTAPPSFESEDNGIESLQYSSHDSDGFEKNNVAVNKFIKPHIKKKIKTDKIANDELSEITNVIANVKTDISLEKYCTFLKETKGKQEINDIIQNLDFNVEQLFSLLIESIRIVKAKSLRARIKRLVKKITKEYGTSLGIELDEFELSQSQGYSTDTSDIHG